MPRSNKKKTSNDIDSEMDERQKSEQAEHADTMEQLRNDVIPTLERLGVARVRVEYSGYGDSGAINFVDYFDAAGKAVSPASEEPALDAEIENVVEEFLPYGFEINEGSQGDIIIDLAKRCLSIQHQENYTVTNDSTKEFSF